MKHYVFSRENRPLHLFKEAYKLWSTVWSDVLYKLDGLERLYSDPFINADFVSAVFDEHNKAVAVHILNGNLLDNIYINREAFGSYSGVVWDKFKQEKINSFLSMEWMCVHPDHKKFKGLSMSKILLGLTCLLQTELGQEASITMTNNSRAVDRLAMEFGGVKVSQDGFDHNVDVSYILFRTKDIVYPVGIKNMVDSLYMNADQGLIRAA